MIIPQNIKSLIHEMEESKDRWFALYMSTWGESYRVRDDYRDTDLWEKPIELGLPASRLKYHVYKPNHLYDILTNRDGEIALNHSQTMFSLIEKLVKETHKILYPEEKTINTGNRKTLIQFLKGDYPFKKVTEKLLLPEEEHEFILARETRNCVIHNGRQIDGRWLETFSKVRNATCIYKEGFDLTYVVRLPQVEDWHDLFLKITKRTENFLQNIPENIISSPQGPLQSPS